MSPDIEATKLSALSTRILRMLEGMDEQPEDVMAALTIASHAIGQRVQRDSMRVIINNLLTPKR